MFFAFPIVAGLRDGDEENDRALRFIRKKEVSAY